MKLRSKWQVRERIQTVLNMLDNVNVRMSELEGDFSNTATTSYYGCESISEIFEDIRCNQMHDINEIMDRLSEIGAFDGLPDENSLDENIERFKQKLSAIELIKEAISVGVLQAADSQKVYICMSDDGEEYWAPFPLEDAALSLVDTDNVDTLRKAVEKAKKESNNG